MSKKILITGGCSFSDSHKDLNTWNTFIEDDYDDVYHTGKDGIGNEYISRLITNKLLTVIEDDCQIDVVVLWSGIHRKLYLTNKNEYINTQIMLDESQKQLDLIANPSKNDVDELFKSNAGQHQDINGNVIEASQYAYNYFLPSLENSRLEEYYTKFTNDVDDWERTAWTIFNLQQLCVSKNVNFYYGYYDSQFAEMYQKTPGHLVWIFHALDHDRCFCPNGMVDWVKENFVSSKGFTIDGYHPSQIAHKHFAKSVIQPFIKNSK